MKVILAEKPSVARELASFLNAKKRQEGYFEGNGYQVTWALGHLVTLKEPDEYDASWKRWSLDTLPMLPDQFQLKVINDSRSHQQFEIVKRLFRSADEIICATDAGREGELIFRYIQLLSGAAKKPFRRLWLSSLTPTAIRAAFDKLRPGREYDRLYAAARCRSEADWIVGMNGTRNYTLRLATDRILWSVGRVQTPVLAMIVRRDDEIRTFKPEPFWELLTRYRETTFKFAGDRFQKEDDASQLLGRVLVQPFHITKVEQRRERSQPPQLYDLTELQRDMNRRYGLSAAATLQTAQALYEAKLITYPRTDSRYLTKDMRREVPKLFESLRKLRADDIDRLDLQNLRFTGRIINDSKVADHHAILPTGKLPDGLAGPKQRVYDAIVTRLIAAFYPACEKEVTTAHGRSAEVPFQAKGYRVIEPGWTALYPRKPQTGGSEKDQPQELPEFKVGESGPHKPAIKQGETSPPKHYTENTLLGAMETAGRMVDDDQLREALKERGLGTPATRAAIIETLLKRAYIQRDKKTLTATDLGRYLIAMVQDEGLKSPELTGQWEAKLRQIEAGGMDARRFMEETRTYAESIVSDKDAVPLDETRFGECPRCGRPVIQGKRGFGCSGWREGCTFVLWPEYRDQPLSVENIRRLLQRRVLPCPLKGEDGRDAIVALTDGGFLTEIPLPKKDAQKRGKAGKGKRSTRNPAQRRAKASGSKEKGAEKRSSPLGVCPKCGADVVEQKKSFSCSHWKDGCQFVIWKSMSGKRISAAMAKKLLKQGRTEKLKGFKSKAGKPFEASLRIIDGEVKFEFDS